MKKKILSLILVGILGFNIVGCSKKSAIEKIYQKLNISSSNYIGTNYEDGYIDMSIEEVLSICNKYTNVNGEIIETWHTDSGYEFDDSFRSYENDNITVSIRCTNNASSVKIDVYEDENLISFLKSKDNDYVYYIMNTNTEGK